MAHITSKGARRMNSKRSIAAVVVIVVGCLLAGCSSSDEAPSDDSPVTLKAVEGTDLFQVELTEMAEKRLGLATEQVRAVTSEPAGTTAATTTIPYAAVVYDSEGASWTYTRAGQHTYVRAEITVDRIQDDLAMLTAGPEVGTAVVVVGAPELLGAEMQIAGEE
jgi:hypothetical protein